MTFDHITPIYDRLARAIFGKAIFRSQIVHFNRIKSDARILIPGGGTGWILHHLPPDCKEVVYVDSSLNMIEKARKLNVHFPVSYYHACIENINLNGKFEIVIANFFFDLFIEEEVERIVRIVDSNLTSSGILLVSDFRNTGIWWQRILLAIMYLFFRIVAGMPAKRLADWKNILIKNGFISISETTYCHDFIVSEIFCKSNFNS